MSDTRIATLDPVDVPLLTRAMQVDLDAWLHGRGHSLCTMTGLAVWRREAGQLMATIETADRDATGKVRVSHSIRGPEVGSIFTTVSGAWMPEGLIDAMRMITASRDDWAARRRAQPRMRTNHPSAGTLVALSAPAASDRTPAIGMERSPA